MSVVSELRTAAFFAPGTAVQTAFEKGGYPQFPRPQSPQYCGIEPRQLRAVLTTAA